MKLKNKNIFYYSKWGQVFLQIAERKFYCEFFNEQGESVECIITLDNDVHWSELLEIVGEL